MKLSHFLYFLVPLASARAVPYHHQIPITEESATEDLTSAKKIDLDATPSIGVHFTTTQAVVAARYPNGTTLDVVQIPGDAGYTDLMSRWMFRYSDYEILRNRNDSVVLAAFISRVHTTIEAQLKIPVKQITPAVVFPLGRAQQTLFQSALLLTGFTSSKSSKEGSVIYRNHTLLTQLWYTPRVLIKRCKNNTKTFSSSLSTTALSARACIKRLAIENLHSHNHV